MTIYRYSRVLIKNFKLKSVNDTIYINTFGLNFKVQNPSSCHTSWFIYGYMKDDNDVHGDDHWKI